MVTKKYYKALISIYIVSFLGCSQRSEVDQLENPKIAMTYTGEIKINEKFLVRLFPENSNWSVVKAYFDCDTTANLQVDVNMKSIIGCEKELFIRKDTILIQFTPTEIGRKKFPDLKILLINKEGDKHSIIDTTFYYRVVQ